MPPRKRGNQTKRTPSTSSTTPTSHAPEHHHALRHTGPSISSRAAQSKSAPVPEPAHAQPAASTSKRPPTEKDAPPRTSLSTFIYVLLSTALLLLAWYVYSVTTLFEKLKDEAGWWGLVRDSTERIRWETIKGWGPGRESGRERGPRTGTDSESQGGLESSLNALADALGIDPVQMASAVRPLVPRASLTGVVEGGSEAVRVLMADTMGDDGAARVEEVVGGAEDTAESYLV